LEEIEDHLKLKGFDDSEVEDILGLKQKIAAKKRISDCFEWDLLNPDNSPGDFAETFRKDYGLSLEERVEIENNVLGQIQAYLVKRCLSFLNWFNFFYKNEFLDTAESEEPAPKVQET